MEWEILWGSFAQVLRGEPRIPGPSKESVISVKSNGAGGGWLLRSAVAIMNRVVSLKFLKGSFNKAFGKDVQFQAMGGRHVLITFPNIEVRDVLIKDPWMAQWFTLVKPWQGEPASIERFVWLSCYGMPLNSWNAESFKNIGEIWGYFIRVDDETLKDFSFTKGKVLIATEEQSRIQRWIRLDVGGLRYDVLVKEESSCANPDELGMEFRRGVNEKIENLQ